MKRPSVFSTWGVPMLGWSRANANIERAQAAADSVAEERRRADRDADEAESLATRHAEERAARREQGKPSA